MANILDYLDWRGDLTLAQDPFNEVDNLILAELSFVDFGGIVPGPGGGRAVPLWKAAEAYFAKTEGRPIDMGVLVPNQIPELLRRALGEDETGCVRVVHRLDRPVGGVMVYARSRMADSILSRQVQAHTFEKDYLAVLEGIPDAPEGVLADLLTRDAAKKQTFVTHTPGPDARPARLSYRVLGVKDGRALVRIRLETGRTHQIRAQFSSRGLPLCGDRKYGAQADSPLGLWSYQIAFFHPQTNERLVFAHDPPQAEPWLAFFDTLKEK